MKKKLISSILILTLILSAALPAGAQISQETCNDLVEAVTPDGATVSGAATVSRGEFATLLGKIAGVDGADLNATLENLYALKAMGKDAAGSFRESEPLSYDDALLGLLRVAGFGEIADLSGGFPAGYEKLAMRYGVVCGKTGSQSLSYDDLAALIYNAMYMPYVETVYNSGKQEYYINDDEYAMRTLFGLEEHAGVLTACGEVNLYSLSGYKDDVIAVNGAVFKCTYANCADMLGKYVTAFSRDVNGEKTVLFVYEDKRNSVTIINADDELAYKAAGKYYTYTENKKKKTESISGAHILYNDHLPQSAASMLYVPNNGYVELIDNNGDGKTDVVKIYNYENYYITGIAQEDDGATLYGDGKEAVRIIDDEDTGNTLLYNADGKKLKLKELAAGMVVSVFSYKTGAVHKAAKLYAAKETVKGYINLIDTDESEITVEETVYKYDPALTGEVSKLMAGTYRNFYIDFNGKIAYIVYETADDKNKGVGYIIKMATNGTLKRGMDIKLFDSSGEMRILTAREKLYVDGELKKGMTDIETALTGKTGIAAYTMYDDGRIRSLDFPTDKQYANTDTLDPLDHLMHTGGGSCRIRTRGRIWGGNMVCNDNVRIFVLPETPETADEVDFSVKSELSEVFRDDGTYDVECYTYNNNGIGVDFVTYTLKETWMEPTALTYVVKSIRNELNDDGIFVPTLELMGAGGNVKYRCVDDSVTENVTTFVGVSQSGTAGTPCDAPKKGDIVKIALNMHEEITDIRMIYDYGKNSFTEVKGTEYYSSSHIVRGIIYDKADDIALMVKRTDATSLESATNSEFEAYKLSLFRIISVDSNGEAKVVKPEAVKAYKKNNGEYSSVVTSLVNGNPSMMVIYE